MSGNKTLLTHDMIVGAVIKATQEFPLKKVDYFGSYADGYASYDSDLDVLVEFHEPAVSILTIIGLKQFLEEELAKPVDVIHAPILPDAIIEIGRTVNIL